MDSRLLDNESSRTVNNMKTFAQNVLASVPQPLRLRYMSYLPSLRKWRDSYARPCRLVAGRESLYEYLNMTVLNGRAIDYLEFGVYRGESLLKWTALNVDPESRFHGFDTFTGLPEDWQKFSKVVKKGKFDLDGIVPRLSDARVSLHKGLFQETLSAFLKSYRVANPLVIHIDSDLYSAALYVLTQMNELATAGTIVMFDEFTSLLHEFRALEDYSAAYRRKYEVLCATRDYIQIAVQMK